MRRSTTGIVLAAALTLLAGCGDGAYEGDASALEGADGVEAVAQQYLRGIAQGDGPAACSLLDAPSQQALVAAHGAGGNCLEAVQAAARSLSADERAALGDVAIHDVEVDGDQGSARVDLSEAALAATGLGDGHLSLDRIEAHWGIALPIAAAG